MFWYEYEVKGLEKKSLDIGYEAETLFYGSSSIRLWENLETDFAGLKPVRLGFGGSTLAACVWFFERLVAGYRPKRIVIYAGDNDLGDGRHPEEVFIFFQQLLAKIKEHFGDIPCYFISLKPSMSRWHIVDRFKFTNNIIADEVAKHHNWHFVDIFNAMLNTDGFPKNEYFLGDGLHLSQKGYLLWKQVLSDNIAAHH
jgi:hypothetical protein